MSSPANGSTAVALIQPSPFDVLPAPPLRARYLRNQRRLQRLSLERLSGQTEAGLQWEAEVARQPDVIAVSAERQRLQEEKALALRRKLEQADDSRTIHFSSRVEADATALRRKLDEAATVLKEA